MKIKVKVPFVFTSEGEDGMRVFDSLPQPMKRKVIDSLAKKRETLCEEVHFVEQTMDFLGRRG